MADSKRERLILMLIGMGLGFGLPFMLAGMALHVTGSALKIEVVRR